MLGVKTIKRVVELHGKSVALNAVDNILRDVGTYDSNLKYFYIDYFSGGNMHDNFNLSFTFDATKEGLYYWAQIRDSLC